MLIVAFEIEYVVQRILALKYCILIKIFIIFRRCLMFIQMKIMILYQMKRHRKLVEESSVDEKFFKLKLYSKD